MKWERTGEKTAVSECGNYQLMKVKNEQYALFKKSDFFGTDSFCQLLHVGTKEECLNQVKETT